MKFEDALKCMREGKKVKSKNVVYSLFIADYTNDFGETYKAICWNDSLGNLIYHSLNHNDIFAEDWEVVDDTDNLLKNNENFNISEGNVKENDINVANNVAQRNSQDLTEQWKKGELPKGYYYAEDDGEELIIHIQEKNGSVMGDDFDLKATDWIKPIAPVPSYEDWQGLNMNCEFIHKCYEGAKEKNKQLEDELKQKHLDYCKEIDWADTKSRYYYSELTRIKKQSNEDYKLAEFREQELKDLLKECREWIEFMEEKSRADENYKGTMYFKNLLTKLDGVLK